MTPTLSVEAVHATVTEVVVAAVTLRPAGVVGACVSGQALVEAAMLALVERLPAAS